jgi:hypothetical protein
VTASLEARLQLHEDERAIAEVLALYGFYADVGDHDAFVALFTDDGAIELIGGTPSGEKGDPAVWEGRAAIRHFIDDPDMHMKIEGRCMHLPALNLRTHIEGDTADAESCSLVLLEEAGSTSIYGAGFTRWTLVRTGERWLIKRRRRYAIGTADRMAVAA